MIPRNIARLLLTWPMLNKSVTNWIFRCIRLTLPLNTGIEFLSTFSRNTAQEEHQTPISCATVKSSLKHSWNMLWKWVPAELRPAITCKIKLREILHSYSEVLTTIKISLIFCMLSTVINCPGHYSL